MVKTMLLRHDHKKYKTNKQTKTHKPGHCCAVAVGFQIHLLWGRKGQKFHGLTLRNIWPLLLALLHFITTLIALIPFKDMQSYSKSGWQCVGMYAKCQLLSKPFFLGVREKMLLIRGLSNLQSKGRAKLLCAEDMIPCCSLRIWLKLSNPRDV